MDQAQQSRAGECTLQSLLRECSATLDGPGLSLDVAASRFATTRLIAESFGAFNELRWSGGRTGLSRDGTGELLHALTQAGLVTRSRGGFQATCGEAARYLTGGWLEEYAGLACRAVQADDVRIGQRLRWRAGGVEGCNEVDALARFGSELLFISCKALKPQFRSGDGTLREKLCAALNEADNLPDHFGPGSRVCLMVTTDLFDESKASPRYPQLYGRSRVLDVALLSQEDLPWCRLQTRLRAIIGSRPG